MKNSTALIQSTLVELGAKLGFEAEREACIEPENTDYAPVHDVVWWMDISPYIDLTKLRPLFTESPIWLNRLSRLPFAVFEIEGSTTSSKNQVGNGANLYACSGLFKFMVVDNGGAGKENDTYRRGVKIARYFRTHWGDRNLAFCDWHHIQQSMHDLVQGELVGPTTQSNSMIIRSGFGGETVSIPIYDYFAECFCDSGLQVQQNHIPEAIDEEAEAFNALKERIEHFDSEAGVYLGKEFRALPESMRLSKCNSARDCRYMPRLDLVAGFYAPMQFCRWFHSLGNAMREDAVLYPFLFMQKQKLHPRFINLIAVEIETGMNKHSHGGILNITNHAYCGIWAAPSMARGHLRFMQNRFGIHNVVHFSVDPWIKSGR